MALRCPVRGPLFWARARQPLLLLPSPQVPARPTNPIPEQERPARRPPAAGRLPIPICLRLPLEK